MTILVSGSAGHLGEALVRTLQDLNQDVVGVDLLASPYTTHVGSIVDRDFVSGAMQGVETVYHTATLHKPHVATHTRQEFINTNISGTLNLLEEALDVGVKAFVFTSTTSLFGDALRPPPGTPATWVTEKVSPITRNIYGASKSSAEELCFLFHRLHALNCIILRTSRFFPEEDDDKSKRTSFTDENIKANEFLFRRVELEDVVNAHLLAASKASDLQFGRYIISATTPFNRADLPRLNIDAPSVLNERMPVHKDLYQQLGWQMFDQIDRVYVNAAARQDLDWKPKYDFAYILESLQQGSFPRSELTRLVGVKGYHSETFSEGPYPV